MCWGVVSISGMGRTQLIVGGLIITGDTLITSVLPGVSVVLHLSS
jgi:hypothetical protein